MIYIATFYSHFGAMRYKKICDSKGASARLMPVPRNLSSSCGTCVAYEGDIILPEGPSLEEVEQIAEKTESGFRVVYMAEN